MVISSLNVKGGVGKSFTAINLSYILSLAGYSVLIIDMDLQSNSTKNFLEEEYDDIDFVHLVCEKFDDYLDFKKYQLIYPSKFYDIDIIPYSAGVEHLARFLHYKLDNIGDEVESYFAHNISLIKDMYDFIVIDVGAVDVDLRNSAVIASDSIIIPLVPENFSIDGLDTFLLGYDELIIRKHLSVDILGVFLNSANLRTNLYREVRDYCSAMLGDRFIDRPVRLSNDVKVACHRYEPLLCCKPRASVTGDFIGMVKGLRIIDREHMERLDEELDRVGALVINEQD